MYYNPKITVKENTSFLSLVYAKKNSMVRNFAELCELDQKKNWRIIWVKNYVEVSLSNHVEVEMIRLGVYILRRVYRCDECDDPLV